ALESGLRTHSRQPNARWARHGGARGCRLESNDGRSSWCFGVLSPGQRSQTLSCLVPLSGFPLLLTGGTARSSRPLWSAIILTAAQKRSLYSPAPTVETVVPNGVGCTATGSIMGETQLGLFVTTTGFMRRTRSA